jgi:mono/diheme cytochrome c family protein
LGLITLIYIYVASERIIRQQYPLPPSRIHATATPQAIANGAHLAVVGGCTGCHGDALQGARFDGAPMEIYAPGLGRLAATWSDGDFDRAIRRGIAPDGRALWIMPSHAYQFVSDEAVVDLLGYVHSLPTVGVETPGPRFDLATRLAILRKNVASEVQLAAGARPPLDLGPRTAAGRQLAAVSCVECHGSDLAGQLLSPSWAPPDLAVVAAYSRADFARFLHTGAALGNRELRSMSQIARQRFAQFTDEEISALYDYLSARELALASNSQGH